MARLILHPASSPARNMAVDEALLREAEVPVLRIYQWSIPAVSLGYFQSCRLVPPGRPFIRRYTGGGLVDHAKDVTYTLVLPRAHRTAAMSTPESYALIHAGVLDALASMGVNAGLAETCAEEDDPSCFRKPVKFDVTSAAGKLAGAAQRRTREGILHQGSILLPYALQNEELRQLLPSALGQKLDVIWETSPLSAQEEERAAELESSRYSQPAWNESK